jgi:hypothetical protein
MIPQLPINYDLGICPPDGEVHWAAQKLKRTGAGISGVCAQDLQCMMTDQRTAQCIIDMVRAVWCTDDRRHRRRIVVRRIDILLTEKWRPELRLQLEVYRTTRGNVQGSV